MTKFKNAQNCDTVLWRHLLSCKCEENLTNTEQYLQKWSYIFIYFK